MTEQQLSGTQLGSAKLKQLIGSGGMGMVYLAHQAHLDRDVAIKVLRSGGMLAEQNEEFLQRFRREAHVIAQLDHVNILPIYEYGEQNGLAYLVMPYLTGGSLYERLPKNVPLPVEEVLLYTEQAAAALDYAHRHKIIHRDIKPRNMLFHADGRLVLVDFGIAHILREDREKATGHTLTGSNNFIGSVDYMAPEMVRGKAVDGRTDIYELGVVLFQMLTGRLPFSGTSPYIIAAQHLYEPAPSLREFNPVLSYGIDTVVRKAMAKDPEERYRTTLELVRALRTAITMGGEEGRSSGGVETEGGTPLPSQPPLGEVTQKIFTAEIPTMQQAKIAPETYLNVPQEGQGRETRVISPISGEQIGGQEKRKQGGRRKKPWVNVLLLLCFCAILFGVGLLLSSNLLGRVHIPLPFIAAPTATTVPVPATATAVPPSPTIEAVQLARQVVRSYYDNINQQKFQDAYNLWGRAYQRSYTFEQFAAGFVTTRHDDIVIQKSDQLQDGSVQVEIILYATDKQSAGSIISAYQGNYVVGLEDGVWKLMKSTLAPVEVPSPVANAS